MLYVGSDPGKTGHIAWISEDGQPLDSEPQPLTGKGRGDTSDRRRMAELVRSLGGIRLWVIERQIPAGGRASLPSLSAQMQAYGSWLGVLAALEVPVLEVTPQAWRKKLGVVAPRYPREKPPTEGGDAEHKAWQKRERARITRQRREGLERAIAAAQGLFPSVDMRASKRARKPSADKAIAFLLAHYARTL